MKKIIFILLLAQTISFMFADSGCYKRDWRWGMKTPLHVECHCNCQQHPHDKLNRNKCVQCGHYRVPVEYKISKSKPDTNKDTCSKVLPTSS